MINITIIKTKNKITSIEATGHSGYAEAGADIVCSAVSSLMQNLLVGLNEVLKINAENVVDENIPHLSVKLPQSIDEQTSKTAQVLMQTTVLSLKAVAGDYSKFIKIKEKQND